MNNTPLDQLIEKINSSNNVLVTVSNNPTTDSLAAAIALTIVLNKLDKHASAVFSGKIPSAIDFLDPEKTLEPDTNSLRDFIIALDKEKADHLRYRVEGDFVRIYITPYRTTITKDDLEFTVGELNVDLVITLGVYDNKSFDSALALHGRILHDSPIVSITKGEQSSSVGTIDWHDSESSSLCEMVFSVVSKYDNDKKVIDQQIATAILTGIVAETERFSNPKTNANSMTIAAKLMAAGANQQLIAAKLSEDHQLSLRQEGEGGFRIGNESVEEFIEKHKDDTLENIDRSVGAKKTLAEAVETQPQYSQPKDDFIESSVIQPPMNAAMVPTPVNRGDMFSNAPSAFDNMVFNPATTNTAPANLTPTPAQPSIQQSPNTPQPNPTISSNVSNEQAALAAVHASFDNVPSLPLPPPVPDFTQLNPAQNTVGINSAYAVEQPQQTKPQNPADPTQFQIPA